MERSNSQNDDGKGTKSAMQLSQKSTHTQTKNLESFYRYTTTQTKVLEQNYAENNTKL